MSYYELIPAIAINLCCPLVAVSQVISKLPIVEGEITTIDIQRGCYDLGVSIVGGIDTPLVSEGVVVGYMIVGGVTHWKV